MSAQGAIVARWEAGEISREIALAQMLLTGAVPDAATLPAALAALARTHADRLASLAALARTGFDADSPVAAAALFDRLARTAPEAGVAFYTLGDPALMAAATAELLAVIRAWAAVDGGDVLDIGCGTGRVARALAPYVRSVIGVDVSAGMIEEARARSAGLANLSFRHGDGHAIPCDDNAFDVALAVDCWPFLVQAGAEVLDEQMGEVARVLRPGGDLLVFNWSYRGDAAVDVADAHALAERYGFDILVADAAPFAIWDGRGFHLRRR